MRIKLLSVVLLIFIVFNSNVCYAIEAFEIWDVGKQFIELGIHGNEGDMTIESAAKRQIETLLDFMWGLGLLTIFISTIFLGVKYMLVSPGEKSRIKQATYPYVIGVVIIFGAVTIWKVLIEILDGSL